MGRSDALMISTTELCRLLHAWRMRKSTFGLLCVAIDMGEALIGCDMYLVHYDWMQANRRIYHLK